MLKVDNLELKLWTSVPEIHKGDNGDVVGIFLQFVETPVNDEKKKYFTRIVATSPV